MITVYHGTALPLAEKIEDHGINPKPGNKYVYFTTDKKVAEHYAKVWTAWLMEDGHKIGLKDVKPVGGILKFSIQNKWLEKDPYSEHEPNQYRVLGKVLDNNVFMKHPIGLEKVEFPELKDKTERLKAYCFWIGIGRATDESNKYEMKNLKTRTVLNEYQSIADRMAAGEDIPDMWTSLRTYEKSIDALDKFVQAADKEIKDKQLHSKVMDCVVEIKQQLRGETK